MCLVSVCPKGTKKYTEEVENFIRAGFHSNLQGSGFMFKRHGETTITIKKGFFNLQALYDALEAADLKDEDELVIHHRVSTGGQISGPNCHPFVLSSIHEEVCMTDGVTEKACLAHNGVFRCIDKYEVKNPNFSDTYAFSRYILSNPNILKLLEEDTDLFSFLFDRFLGWSKLAILFPNRDVLMFGDFVEENGYYHSNQGYCRLIYNRGGVETEVPKKTLPTPSTSSKNSDTSAKTVMYPPIKILDSNYQADIRLDGSIIRITKDNYNKFYFIRKADTAHRVPFLLNAFDKPEYDKDAAFLLSWVNYENKAHAVTLQSLHTHFWFYPRPMWLNMYRDYLNIVNKLAKGGGKKTVKKLYLFLNKIKNRDALDKIFWHRIGDNVYVGALIEWYNYWFEEYNLLELPFSLNRKKPVLLAASDFNEVGFGAEIIEEVDVYHGD